MEKNNGVADLALSFLFKKLYFCKSIDMSGRSVPFCKRNKWTVYWKLIFKDFLNSFLYRIVTFKKNTSSWSRLDLLLFLHKHKLLQYIIKYNKWKNYVNLFLCNIYFIEKTIVQKQSCFITAVFLPLKSSNPL